MVWEGDETTRESWPAVELPPGIPLTLQMMGDPVVPVSVAVRGARGLAAGGRGKLQREVAGDGDGGEVLFGGISDAGGGQGDAGSGGENGGRGVISVGVDGAAVVWAGGAGEAPTDGEIGLATAGNAR